MKASLVPLQINDFNYYNFNEVIEGNFPLPSPDITDYQFEIRISTFKELKEFY